MNYIQFINALVFVESFLIAQSLAAYHEKRKLYPLLLILTLVAGTFGSYFLPAIIFDSFVATYFYTVMMYMVILILVFLSTLVTTKGKPLQLLFCSVTGYLIHHFAGKVSSLILRIFFKGDDASFFNFWYAFSYVWIVLGIFALFLFLFKRYSKPRNLANQKRIVYFTVFAVMTTIFVSCFQLVGNIHRMDSEFFSVIMDIDTTLESILVIFILFIILKQERVDRENAIIKELNKESKSHYEISKATMMSLHDMKHRVNAILNNNMGLSEEEMKDINDKIFIFENQYNTGNETLNIILTEKGVVCKQKNIHFNCMVDGSKISFMEIDDIYSLFGNALTNAIDATSQYKDEEAKMITLIIKGDESHTLVHLENTFSQKIKIVDGIPMTDKDDINAHGFGIKSMKNIVEKYKGNMTITLKDNLFLLDFLFYNIDQKS